jgi:hypothetical protein
MAHWNTILLAIQELLSKMATPKYQGIKLGPAGLEIKAGECEIFSKTVAPVDGIPGVGDGKDGDIWIQVSGSTSSLYQKANNAWIAMSTAFSGSAITITDNAVAQPAFSYNAASYRTAIIDYYIIAPTGELERGQFNIVNDTISANGSQYNVNDINGPLGVDFDFALSAGNVNVKYTSGPSPTLRVLFYRIRS